jgi:hypothetical protein
VVPAKLAAGSAASATAPAIQSFLCMCVSLTVQTV